MFNPYSNKHHNDQLRDTTSDLLKARFRTIPAERIFFLTICYSHSADPEEARINALLRGSAVDRHMRQNGIEFLQVVEEQAHEGDAITFTGHGHAVVELPRRYVSTNPRRQRKLFERFKHDHGLYAFTADYQQEYAQTASQSRFPIRYAIHIQPLYSADKDRELANLAGYATKCLTRFKCPLNNSFEKKMKAADRDCYLAALEQIAFISATDPILLKRQLELLITHEMQAESTRSVDEVGRLILDRHSAVLSAIGGGLDWLRYWIEKIKRGVERKNHRPGGLSVSEISNKRCINGPDKEDKRRCSGNTKDETGGG
ncbi:MAG: hypothetical protein GVY30_01010, partial [Chloroflexi bacterium]|nr:hypothetical protein [Chloroflexota bacterium]